MVGEGDPRGLVLLIGGDPRGEFSEEAGGEFDADKGVVGDPRLLDPDGLLRFDPWLWYGATATSPERCRSLPISPRLGGRPSPLFTWNRSELVDLPWTWRSLSSRSRSNWCNGCCSCFCCPQREPSWDCGGGEL